MDKDFIYCLYRSSTLLDLLEKYCTPKVKSKDPLERLKAERLLNCWGLLNDSTFFERRIKEAFAEVCKIIDETFPEISYEFLGRIKALVSLLNKADEVEENVKLRIQREFINSQICLCGEEDPSPIVNKIVAALNSSGENETKEKYNEFYSNYIFEENPFNRIRDFFAFRIIIEDNQPGEKIDELYKVSNILIEAFLKSETFTVVSSHPLVQTGDLKIDPSLIYIPTKSGIKDEYRNYVKDYVSVPKVDGYQSIHFVVFDPLTGRHFEVQIRTRSMDIISETLANHELYKDKKYKKKYRDLTRSIDYSKIKIKGFRYFKYTDPKTDEEKEFISDKAGLFNSIPIKLEFENFSGIQGKSIS